MSNGYTSKDSISQYRTESEDDLNDPSSEESISLSQLESRLQILEEGAATWLRNRSKPQKGHDIIPPPIITRVPTEQWRSIKSHGNQLQSDTGVIMVSTTFGMDKSVPRPDRVAISSGVLITMLNKSCQVGLSTMCNVLVWPFKQLVVNEQEIKKALRDAEEIYQNNSTDRRSQPAELSKSPDKAVQAELSMRKRTVDELRCLIQFMDTDMHPIFETVNEIQKSTLKNIGFDYLWLLFKPGDHVFETQASHGGSPLQAYRILSVAAGRFKFNTGDPPRSQPPPQGDRRYEFASSHSKMTPFIIDCIAADFDGQIFGPKGEKIVILPYTGERLILSLEVYPANFDPHCDKKRGQLLTRGKLFAHMAKGAHKRYTGMCLREPLPSNGNLIRTLSENVQEVDSDVVIDQELAVKYFGQITGKEWRLLGGSEIIRPTPMDPREIIDNSPMLAYSGNFNMPPPPPQSDVASDFMIDSNRRNDFVSATDLLEYRSVDNDCFSDDFLILLSPRIYGYALLNRKWLPLQVDLLTDPILLSSAGSLPQTRFEDLVLPRGHRQLLETIIKYQLRQKDVGPPSENKTVISMDVVKGKGQGLVILLHGPPGVGKTSTAESDAFDVEEKLDEYCYLANKWRCVLLLDEADVFLSKREKGDFKRNSLVSVFLRTLEYFSGVLILTTNRVGEIDEAFRSRIHVCLFYPGLDQLSTAKIWEKNFARIKAALPELEVEEDEIRQFYEALWRENEKHPTRHWNGRQIKNAFQTALAFADRKFREGDSRGHSLERPILRAQYFKRVAYTSAHFDDYFATVHGLEREDAYGTLAAREEIRKDHIPIVSFLDPKEQRSLALSRRPTFSDSDEPQSEEDVDSEDIGNPKTKATA